MEVTEFLSLTLGHGLHLKKRGYVVSVQVIASGSPRKERSKTPRGGPLPQPDSLT